MSKPTVISLFAGCGGSSLGYQLAGCQVLASVEYDPHACATYRANHSNTRLYEADIATLDPVALMEELNLKHGELTILDGSPPCQGFSTAGKRQIADPRNQLFQHYIRFLAALQPKAFVMENVPGMAIGRMKSIFAKIIAQLQDQGYTVQARVLNAAHYGVPQQRQRLIVMGFRNDLNQIPKHPKPATAPMSIRVALKGLATHGAILEPAGKALTLAKALQSGESGATMHRRYRQKPNDFSLFRLHWDKPIPTVCKTIRQGQCGLLHPAEHRFLSIGELKRICGFPDDFILEGTFEQQWGRLGNAVPPSLAKAVATTLIQQLGD